MQKNEEKIETINAYVFFDGQNLYRSSMEAFGIAYPDFDPKKLAHEACQKLGWNCSKIKFYTGVPQETKSPGWHAFWKQKKMQMSRDGIDVTTTVLRYRMETFSMGHGADVTKEIAREKGIDVRIALDMVAAAYSDQCNGILVFSQDQDLAEAVSEVKAIAKSKKKFIHLASAFPMSRKSYNRNGLKGTKEIYIDEDLYLKCKDPRGYPKP